MPEIIAKKWSQKINDLGIPNTVELDITGDSYILLTHQNTRIHSAYHAEVLFALISTNQRLEEIQCKFA